MPLPPIYDGVKRSRLIDERDLEAVAQKTCAKLGGYAAASEEETRIHQKSEFIRSLFSDGANDTRSSVPQSPTSESTRSSLISHSNSNISLFQSSEATGYYSSSHRNDLEIDLLDDQVKNEFERILLKKLVKRRLVNSWQAMKLRDGHTSFFLGKSPKRYRIVDQLGKGGYGAVYHAREEGFASNMRSKVRNDVAIKVLQNKSKPEARELFQREYEIAKLFKDPNIVEFRGFSNEQGADFYVLEYVDGGDANKLLKKYGKLHYKIACYIISETAKALSYLHKNGVIHRDVKPGNILLMKSGEVRLTDFGFLSAIKNPDGVGDFSEFGQKLEEWEDRIAEVSADRRNKIQGTKGFIAPEQFKNPRYPNPLWDIYSLGCAFYTLLTGSIAPEPPSSAEELRIEQMQQDSLAPFTGTYRELTYELPEAPRELADLVMRMLAKRPNKRIQTARQVVNELKRWVAPDQRALFSKIKLSETSDHENVWSEENIRRCFNIPQASTLTLSAPGAGILTQQDQYTGSTSVSAIFYQEVFGRQNDLPQLYPSSEENPEETSLPTISDVSPSSNSPKTSVTAPPQIQAPSVKPQRNRGGQSVRELSEFIEERRRLNLILATCVLTPLAIVTLVLAIIAVVK